MSRGAHDDSTSKLSDNDIKAFARHLVGATISDHLRYGWFEKDLIAFNEENQLRIKSELAKIERSFSAIWQAGEKPAGNKKKTKKKEGQDNAQSN